MWQKCPVCNGKGTLITTDVSKECNVCNGRGIISEITGKPPSQCFEDKNSDDFRDRSESQQEYFGLTKNRRP